MMTLSQIIARQQNCDREIPTEGHWSIRIEIQKGKIVYMEKTEKIKP
jgi:hypothetical protein